MRILFAVSTLKRAGPTNQLLNLANLLLANGHSPHVMTLSEEPQDSMYDEFVARSIPVCSLGLSRSQFIFAGRQAFLRKINELSPDIIHTQGIRADVAAAAFFRRANTIATLRNIPFEDYVSRYGAFVGYIMANIHIRALRRLRRVALVSHSARKRLGSHLPNTAVVPNGVDTLKFRPPTVQEKREARAQLGLSATDFVFVSTGHLSPLKDPMTLIRGFKCADPEGRSRLLLVGDGMARAECEKLANNQVVFAGRTNAVLPFLWAADAFVTASTTEGMPNALLEALATGLPVCVSNIEPHLEVLASNRFAGETFRVGDAEQAALALGRLMHNAPMRQSAAHEVAQNFSAIACAKNYEALYEDILFG